MGQKRIKVMLKAKNPHTLKSDWITFIVDREKFATLEKAGKLEDNEYIMADISFCIEDGKVGLFGISQAKRADRFMRSAYNNLGIYNLSLIRCED